MKKKILMVLTRFPYPTVDGTRYKLLYNIAAGLCRDFDVEFLVITMEHPQPAAVEYLEEHFGKVHVVSFSKIAFGWRALKGVFSREPLQVSAFYDRNAERWIREHAHEYDAFYVHTIRLVKYFEHMDKVQKRAVLVDFNDALSFNYQDAGRFVSLPMRMFYAVEVRRVAAYETKIVSSFFHFNTVAERDRDIILSGAGMTIADTDFSVVGHGIQMSDQIVPLEVTHNKIFFIGQLDYAPNRDSVLFFIDHILPALVQKIPDVELVVIGRGALSQSHKDIPHVTFTGFVPDVFPVMSECSLLVAPIRFGAGTPSKIIEAMAYGMPVLTTPIGASGISGVEDGKNVLIVPEWDTDQWMASVEKVLGNAAFRAMLGTNARFLIRERYSSESAEASFRKIFHGIIG